MMKQIRRHIKYLLSLLLLIVIIQLSHAAMIEIVIVVHSNNSLEDISSVDLRRIWLGKKHEIDGVALNPINAETQLNSKIVFYKSILNKSRKGLRKYYIREELKGSFKKPKSVKTLDMLLNELTTDNTAISFMNRADISDSSNLKILTVDGKNSIDIDYIIK